MEIIIEHHQGDTYMLSSNGLRTHEDHYVYVSCFLIVSLLQLKTSRLSTQMHTFLRKKKRGFWVGLRYTNIKKFQTKQDQNISNIIKTLTQKF